MQWTMYSAVGEPENAMKRRKALVSEEELLETKYAKRVRNLLKHVSRLCTGNNWGRGYTIACVTILTMQIL